MAIDLGVSYTEAQDLSKFPVVDAGDYAFQVESVEEDETRDGQPMLTWRLKIINATNPEFNNVSLIYNTPLPHRGNDGQMVTKGIAFLYRLAEGVGRPWDGTVFDERGLLGMTGKMQVTQRGYCGTCDKNVPPGRDCPTCGAKIDPRNNVNKIYPR